MRPHHFLVVLLTATGVSANDARYEIPADQVQVSKPYVLNGEIVYDVAFQLKRTVVEGDEGKYFVVFRENGQKAHSIELEQVRSRSMTSMLALDMSGSMARTSRGGKTKMREAQEAARVFLNRLPDRADLGLVLFDHLVKEETLRYPTGDPSKILNHRIELGGLIDAVKPDGGTAYLDAAHQALTMLSKYKGDRSVVLMTDGIDLNSKKKLADVVELAKESRIPIHVIGVGDPGFKEPVATVLVLDASNSMGGLAVRGGKVTKWEALKDAANRFFDLMRPGAEVGLLPFNRTYPKPKEYVADPKRLKDDLARIRLALQTLLYDAIDAGLDSVSERPEGTKRRLLALTDGMDTRSKTRPEDLIRKARARKIPIDTIHFGPKTRGGKPGASAEMLRRLAVETGGRFLHSETEAELVKHFEQLSIDIHGDGIDEEALKALAGQTGGRYFTARDASELKLLYGELADRLESTYRVTFPSLNQTNDGTVALIKIAVEDSAGRAVSNVGERERARFGLVVPGMDYLVYLVLLAVLLGLLWLPNTLRRAA